MTPRIFRRISVDTHFSQLTTQRATIAWAMEPSFVEPGPWTFTLQRGFAPTEDKWEDIAIVVDQPWVYDNRPASNLVGTPVYYRIKLVDGNGVTYYSQVQVATAYWNRYDWSLAKEVIRKETLVQHNKAGVNGWVLKRRYFGERCPVCTNQVTGQIESSTCQTCYGTGIVGGYYPAYEYWVTMNASQGMRKLTADQGLISTVIETVRALAYPVAEANDIWVHGQTNTRYYIAEVKTLARHRGIDLIVDLRLNEVPNNHIIYEFPITCPPQPS
jgi:hypothetical protein